MDIESQTINTPTPPENTDTKASKCLRTSYLWFKALVVVAGAIALIWWPYIIWACDKIPTDSAIVNTAILINIYGITIKIHNDLKSPEVILFVSEDVISIIMLVNYTLGIGLMLPSTIFSWIYVADQNEQMNSLNGQFTLAYGCSLTIYVFIMLVIYIYASFHSN